MRRPSSNGSGVGSALVILDNCEHVVEVAADLAVRLLDHAPALRILCTSQLPLEIDGERVVELAPLELPDAVELFGRRASRLTGTARDDERVLDLCRSLDGLPLAIELAAARTRTLTVEEITRRLDDRFSVLKDPSSRRPERRRSLRSTIGWSYELLFPDDQRGLWALATFAGGAPLPAVEFVLEALGVPAAADDRRGGQARRPARWSPSTTTRVPTADLATGCWTASGRSRWRRWPKRERPSVALDVARPLVRRPRPRASTSGVRSADQDEHLRFARTERANIDAALAWSVGHDPRRALDLAVRVRLGLGRPRRQPRRRADRGRPGRGDRARHGPPAGRRPAPGRLDRGLDR